MKHPQADSPSPSFRALFEAEIGFVLRVLRRHGVRDADLADACQDTFLTVHRRLSEFEGRSSLRTWVCGIAIHTARAYRRKAHRVRERLTADEPASMSQAPAAWLESAEQREVLALVETALSSTSEERREVFVLYELEGMTMREVAEALGISENTGFSRLYAARRELRAFLLGRTQARRRAGGGR